MEDIVETLLGAEIVDETDKIVDLQDMAKKQWKSRYKKMTMQQNQEINKPIVNNQ